jgi:hypothetical protein
MRVQVIGPSAAPSKRIQVTYAGGSGDVVETADDIIDTVVGIGVTVAMYCHLNRSASIDPSCRPEC